MPAPPAPTGTDYWVCLRSGGADVTSRRSVFVPTGGSLQFDFSALNPGPGTYTVAGYSAWFGGVPQFESAPFVVPAGSPASSGDRIISGYPTSAVTGSALVGEWPGGQIHFRADFLATPHAAFVTAAAQYHQAVGSALIGSAVALGGRGGIAPALTPPAAGTVRLAMLDGPTGNVVWLGNPITVAAAAGTPPPVESGGHGVPSSGTAGTALAGPISFNIANVSTPYAALVTTAAVLGQSASGKVVGSAVSLSGTSGTVPALTPFAAGTVRVALLNGAAGTILALSANITVAAAPLVESASLSGVPSSATAGSALSGTITFTATNISTPFVALVTSAATVGQAVGGALIGSAVALSGSSGTVPTLTPPSAGTVYLALLNGPTGTVRALSGAITVAATPTTQSGGGVTLTGVPSSITAGQPLSGVTFALDGVSPAFVLYNVTAGAEEGARQ